MSQKIGDECTRCDGTGIVYEYEIWEEEPTECPYFDVDAGVECKEGTIIAWEDAAARREEQ